MIKILSRSVMFLSVHGVFFSLVAGLIISQPAPANAAYQICKKISANGSGNNIERAKNSANFHLGKKYLANRRGGYRQSGGVTKNCLQRTQTLYICYFKMRICAQRH